MGVVERGNSLFTIIETKRGIAMSYKKPNTGNPMNDYFTALSDFTMLSEKLLTANNEESFEIWLEKTEAIDKRALFLFMQKHKNEIPKKHLNLAQRRFSKPF